MLPSPDERPFSRSYGAILPSSLTWFLSRTLVCSTHPPVSVCGTATMAVDFPRVFSAAWLGRLRPGRSQGPASRLGRSLRACTRTTSAGRALPSASPRDTPLRFRNVRLMSIAYASPPRLRDRLTLGGRTWPRKPWICGGQDSRLPCRYSCLHGLRSTLQARSRSPFGACSALSYQIDLKVVSAISAARFSPDHFRRGDTRPVGYYAVFKWWLPLSQHPGCPRGPTSLQSTKRAIGGLNRRSGLFPSRRRSLSPAV